MDVLLSATKTCCCCGAASLQAVYADAAAFAEGERSATLDGAIVTGRLNRGMQVCDSCGYSAPDLQAMPDGVNSQALQDAITDGFYQAALRRRGAGSGTQATATRWVAYADAFDGVLTPEQAGMAWVNAAAELEQPRLHRIGSEDRASSPKPEQADAARRRAITHLMLVFEAEFVQTGGHVVLSGLRRTFNRWRIGERPVRATRWSARDHVIIDTSHEIRFELACALTDMLRRTGEFVAARSVALRALHTGQCPNHLAKTLSFQIRLSRAEDVASYRQRDRVGTIVAFPSSLEAVVEVADMAEFGLRPVAA